MWPKKGGKTHKLYSKRPLLDGMLKRWLRRLALSSGNGAAESPAAEDALAVPAAVDAPAAVAADATSTASTDVDDDDSAGSSGAATSSAAAARPLLRAEERRAERGDKPAAAMTPLPPSIGDTGTEGGAVLGAGLDS
jgi:hypothetical protein